VIGKTQDTEAARLDALHEGLQETRPRPSATKTHKALPIEKMTVMQARLDPRKAAPEAMKVMSNLHA
jgi:AhpD family alkylhydroperoxidase